MKKKKIHILHKDIIFLSIAFSSLKMLYSTILVFTETDSDQLIRIRVMLSAFVFLYLASNVVPKHTFFFTCRETN